MQQQPPIILHQAPQDAIPIYNAVTKLTSYLPIPQGSDMFLSSNGWRALANTMQNNENAMQSSAIAVQTQIDALQTQVQAMQLHANATQNTAPHVAISQKVLSDLDPSMLSQCISVQNMPQFLLSADDHQVILQYSDISGPSTSTAFMIPSLIPDNCRPKITVNHTATVIFNGTRQMGVVQVDPTGHFTVFPDHNYVATSWNNAGIKGVEGQVLVWIR